MKPFFQLPNTKLCLVVTFRGNQRNETLLTTPANNEALRNEMLKRRVGYSEIRAVKAVNGNELAAAMSGV